MSYTSSDVYSQRAGEIWLSSIIRNNWKGCVFLKTTPPKQRGKGKKPPIAQTRAENEKLKADIAKLKASAYCHMCDKHKTKDAFYINYDPRSKGRCTPICIECAKKIALRVDSNGYEHTPTKESLIETLQYLDKPFFESVYKYSVEESMNEFSGNKRNFYGCYMKNIQMQAYAGKRFQDSDMFKNPKQLYEDEMDEKDVVSSRAGMDTYENFQKNKEDVIRLLDYDPFEHESVKDQPLLYSQLLGMLDTEGEANEDMMRIASSVSIVRGFLQQSKIDDSITKMMSDPLKIHENSANIKSLESTKGDITRNITSLAAENCISLKNNKRSKKGENTWTGKIKKMKTMNLRESEVNGFDIWTCKGMQQVIEMSDASIMKQLKLDESEWSDIVAEQRELLRKTQDDCQHYKEISRILLRENIDLKDLLEENDLLDSDNLVNLDHLYSYFSGEGGVADAIEDES